MVINEAKLRHMIQQSVLNLYRGEGHYSDIETGEIKRVPDCHLAHLGQVDKKTLMKAIPALVYWDFKNPARPDISAAYVHVEDPYNEGYLNLREVWDVMFERSPDGNIYLEIGGRTSHRVRPDEPVYYC